MDQTSCNHFRCYIFNIDSNYFEQRNVIKWNWSFLTVSYKFSYKFAPVDWIRKCQICKINHKVSGLSRFTRKNCRTISKITLMCRWIETKLWLTLKHQFFKQCLINMLLSFKKDGFNRKLYFLVQINQHFFRRYCLEIHTSLNNAV